jgi:riboflavin transporter FmnP
MTDATHSDVSESVKGISGWLLIPAIGLVLLPIRNLYIILFTINRLPLEVTSDPRTWVIGAMEIILIAALVVVAFFFFKKRRIAITSIIVLMAACIPFEVVQIVIKFFQYDQLDVYTFSGLVEAFIISSVFIPYFMKSQRVKNTFTR